MATYLRFSPVGVLRDLLLQRATMLTLAEILPPFGRQDDTSELLYLCNSSELG